MNRRCRPLLCGLAVAVDVARRDGPLAWVSRLLNGREDRADIAGSTTHQQRSENAERRRGAAQVAPAFVIGMKKNMEKCI